LSKYRYAYAGAAIASLFVLATCGKAEPAVAINDDQAVVDYILETCHQMNDLQLEGKLADSIELTNTPLYKEDAGR
jgi:hypothetical protein